MRKKFRYDGVEYDDLDEMPEDVRTLFEKNGEPSEGQVLVHGSCLSGHPGRRARGCGVPDSEMTWYAVERPRGSARR
jgi:hypothetical protein